MSDYSGLIARMRAGGNIRQIAAADALEAQARRIAGYQKDADDYRDARERPLPLGRG